MRIMNQAIHVNLRGLSGPGNFADLDLLEVRWRELYPRGIVTLTFPPRSETPE